MFACLSRQVLTDLVLTEVLTVFSLLLFFVEHFQPILAQCSIFISPENSR